MPTLASRILTDRAKFLNTSDFAVSVRYTPVSSGARTVNVQWFESPGTDGPLGIAYENTSPRALGALSDFVAASHGETLVKDDVTYYIRGVESDEGMIWLKLSRN